MAKNPEITIDVASVKVMRSFDYCHFEVCLSTTLNKDLFAQDANQPTDNIVVVDELRKTAARLADKAVEQYKTAKANYARRESDAYERQNEVSRMAFIRNIAEGDRTVSQQAELKAFDDTAYHARRAYDYEDDYQDDDNY